MSLLSIVAGIKDTIALFGSSGCTLAQFLAQSESSQLTAKQLLYILKRFLIPSGYIVSGPSGCTFQNVGEIAIDTLHELICFAPNFERWKALRIENSGGVPSNDYYDLATVEVIAAAGHRGCLLSELVDGLNHRQDIAKIDKNATKHHESSSKKRPRVDDEAEIEDGIEDEGGKKAKSKGPQRLTMSNIHPYADKPVMSGIVVKRIVMPSRGNIASVTGPSPVIPRSKHTFAGLLHLRRFACEYEPADDGLEFHAGDDIKESVFLFIRRVLQMRAKGGIMPVADLAKFMGVNSRITQSLREYLLHYHTDEKEDKDGLDFGQEGSGGHGFDAVSQLRVFMSHVTPMKPNGELCPIRNSWCIELLDSSDAVQAAATAPHIPASSAYSETYYCSRNLGLFEGLSHAIRTRSLPLTSNGGQMGPGLTSTDAKITTGCTAKRAYKLTCEFVNSFSYSVEKFQDGKHQRFRVRDKGQTSLQKQKPPTIIIQKKTPVQDISPPEEVEIVAASNPELTDTLPASTTANQARKRESKLEQNCQLQTFEQMRTDVCQVNREQVAVTYLREQGGASSRYRVESEMRTIESGPSKMDIRTIRRSLTRLIQAGIIEEVTLDKESEFDSQPLCILLLTEAKSQPDLIPQTITRLQAQAEAAAVNNTTGKKRSATAVDGGQATAEHVDATESELLDSNSNSNIMELEVTDAAVVIVPETTESLVDVPKKKRVRLSAKRSIWTAHDMDLKAALSSGSESIFRKLIAALNHPPGPLLCALGLHVELFYLLKFTDSEDRRRNFINEVELGLGSTQFLSQIRASYILFHFSVYTDDLEEEEGQGQGQLREVEQLVAEAIESEWSCEEFIRREAEISRHEFRLAFSLLSTGPLIALLTLLVALGAVRASYQNPFEDCISYLLSTYPQKWFNQDIGGPETVDGRQRELFAALSRRTMSIAWNEPVEMEDAYGDTMECSREDEELVLSMLQDQVAFALCLIPLGAKKQLQGDFDVKLHWVANCLPALALSKTGTGSKSMLAKRLQEGWERVKPIPSSWFNGRIVERLKRKRKKSSKKSISDKVPEMDSSISGLVPDQSELPQDLSRDEENVVDDDEDDDDEEEDMTEDWSLKQAALLLESFLKQFLERTPLNGLPDLLKVRSRHRKVRVTFNPRTSYFRAGVKDVDFMSLGVALVQSLSPRLKGRSRMSCKNHLLQLVRQGYNPLSMLCWVIVCRSHAMDDTLTDLWNLEMERDESNLTQEQQLSEGLSVAVGDGDSIKHLLLEVYTTLDQAKKAELMQQMLTYPVQLVTAVLREFFVSGWLISNTPSAMKKVGGLLAAIAEGNHNSTSAPADDKDDSGFLLSKQFFENLCGVLLGPFFYSIFLRAGGGTGKSSFPSLVRTEATHLLEPSSRPVSAIEAVALSHVMAYGLGLEEGTDEEGSSSIGGWGATLRVNEEIEGAAAVAPSNPEEAGREHEDDDEERDDEEEEGCSSSSRSIEVRVVGHNSIAEFPTKEKALSEYSGHYDTALQRLQVTLTWQTIMEKKPSPESAPGELEHSTTTSDWSSLLKWKVLSILAARPGMNLLSIHRSLHLLDMPRTVQLLDSMLANGAIVRSAAAAITDRYTAALRDPFSASRAIFHFSEITSSSSSSSSHSNSHSHREEGTAGKDWSYFVAS